MTDDTRLDTSGRGGGCHSSSSLARDGLKCASESRSIGAASTAPRQVTKARRFIAGAMLAPDDPNNNGPRSAHQSPTDGRASRRNGFNPTPIRVMVSGG